MTPDIQGMMPLESLQAARSGVLTAFGVLPALFVDAAQGPLVREAQRHLCQWTLQPLAMLLGEEATEKLGVPVMIDTLRPVQAYDVGGRARALGTIIDALARGKEAGLSPQELGQALTQVNWGPLKADRIVARVFRTLQPRFGLMGGVGVAGWGVPPL